MFSYFKKIGDQVVHPPHRRLMQGLFWSFGGNLVSLAITFIITIILARYWGKTGYGQYGIIIATAMFFSEFAGIGLGITATKYISQHRISDPSFVGRLLGSLIIIGTISALLFSLLFFIFSPLISSYYLNSPNLLDEVRISALLLFVNALNGLFTSILSGFEKFRDIAIINLIRAMLAVPLFFLAVYWLDLRGAIYALIILGFIMLILQWIFLEKTVKFFNLKIYWNIDLKAVERIFKFGITMFVTGLLVSIAIWLSNVITAHQIKGIGEVGVINVANQWRSVLVFLPSVVVQVLLPLLSANLEEEQISDFNSIINLSLNVIILALFPICAGLMIFAPFIISWYGPTFANGEIALVGIILSCLIAGITSVFGPILQSREQVWTAFLINFSWSLIIIGSMLLFGNRYGAASYTFGSAAGYLLINLVFYQFYIRKYIPKPIGKRIILAICNACVITLFCYLNIRTHNIYLALAIGIYTILSVFFMLDPLIRKLLMQNLVLVFNKQAH